MKKKILFFVSGNVGGAERMTLTYAKLLSENQFEKKIFTFGSTTDIIKFIPDNIITKHIRSNIYKFSFLIELYHILKQENPDIVFSSLSVINSRLIFTSLFFSKIKCIVRNNNTFNILNKKSRILYKYLYRFTDIIIAQTLEMKEEILGFCDISEERVVVVNNPIDTESIDNKINEPSPFIGEDVFRYVVVGRFAPAKGQDIALRSFLQVSAIKNDAHLYFIGKYSNDKYFNEIKSFVQNNGLSSKVHFIGFTDNPYIYIKYADCFVLTSRLEGLPNVLIEAQYLKKKSIVTNCVPIINRIVNKNNGLICDVEDIEGITKAMLTISNIEFVHTNYKGANTKLLNDIFSNI